MASNPLVAATARQMELPMSLTQTTKEPLNAYEARANFGQACEHLEPLPLIALYLRFSGYGFQEIGEMLHVSHTMASNYVSAAVECLRSRV